jgi:hypothetical protein
LNDNAQAIVGNISTGVGEIKKVEPNPMKAAEKEQEFAFQKAPRCTAKFKRSGKRCKAPAVRGWNVCRFHGARGGAPKGKANGAWQHGCYSQGAKAERFRVKLLLKDATSLRKLFSKDKPDC